MCPKFKLIKPTDYTGSLNFLENYEQDTNIMHASSRIAAIVS